MQSKKNRSRNSRTCIRPERRVATRDVHLLTLTPFPRPGFRTCVSISEQVRWQHTWKRHPEYGVAFKRTKNKTCPPSPPCLPSKTRLGPRPSSRATTRAARTISRSPRPFIPLPTSPLTSRLLCVHPRAPPALRVSHTPSRPGHRSRPYLFLVDFTQRRACLRGLRRTALISVLLRARQSEEMTVESWIFGVAIRILTVRSRRTTCPLRLKTSWMRTWICRTRYSPSADQTLQDQTTMT